MKAFQLLIFMTYGVDAIKLHTHNDSIFCSREELFVGEWAASIDHVFNVRLRHGQFQLSLKQLVSLRENENFGRWGKNCGYGEFFLVLFPTFHKSTSSQKKD